MAKQTINIGSSANKGDGDPLRTAFDKINDNFDELYAATTLDLDSIGSNMIPTTDGTFALGSATKQWSDLYVKDFLYIGGTRLETDASGNIVVSGGSLQIKDVQGDIFADDSTKVFDSATQTFTGKFEGELVGTVAADDSTVLIDGVAGTINAGALTGALPAIDGSALTGVVTAGGDFEGNLSGSVFADDSTLLVDGVNGKVVGDVENTEVVTTTVQGRDSANLNIYRGTSGTVSLGDASSGNVSVSDSGISITSTAGVDINGAATGTVEIGTGATTGNVTIGKVGNTTTINGTFNAALTGNVTGNVDGDIIGSVFADDSTLLVDGVNGTIPAANLTGALPAIDGSALTGVTTAFSNITSTPTTLAGYGITDAANTGSATTFTANVLFDTGVQEKFATLTGSTGVTVMDCDNGQVFYLTGAAGDITANFTNLGLTAEYGTNVTVIINQGATPYEVTAVQIGGSGQTIEWQGGLAPTGNANGIDSFSFTILNDGGSYVVLGQMVDFT